MESIDDSQLAIIEGALWDFTNEWDCGGNDIGYHSNIAAWGTEGGVEARQFCANKCLSLPNCEAFNFPSPAQTNGGCYLKENLRKSTADGRDWNCGSSSSNWHYYTLLDRNGCAGRDICDRQLSKTGL